MFEDFFDAIFDIHDETSDGSFHEFEVSMYTVDTRDMKVVDLTIWAAGFEEALTCGEVLSAVYLA